ncbi:MAG: tetratricopeptide repeat protein [Ktedonobacterales bacterium]
MGHANSSGSSDQTFEDLLRTLRLASGLTQADLAERANLSVRGLSDLERGINHFPRRETLLALADALALTEEVRYSFFAAARRRPTDPSSLSGSLPAPSSTAEPGGPVADPRTPSAFPTGTVTFLFTDIEGSTRLLQRLGDAYAHVLVEHQRLLRQTWAEHGGVEVDTAGDGFFVAFPTAPAALAAAAAATRSLAAHSWPEGAAVRVRMGLHTGAPQLVGERYIGLDVHRAARIAAAGHGGQILLSASTRVLAAQDLPPGAILRELGVYRLKDLQQPEPISQLVLDELPSDFPPLKTLDRRAYNLPIQPTVLLGREEQLAALRGLLGRVDVRLVTVTGTGGIGKTRFALQVAAEVVEDFADGVWFVRLSRLVDPDLVLPTIAQTLGLEEVSGQPVARTLQEHLRERQLLLVLDNFEQLVAAAPELSELLALCPRLKVLVTGRVALRLRAEHEYPLVPLALPESGHLLPPEQLTQFAAVALFVERASAIVPDFAVTTRTAPTIAQICARLDGLPLAIELAAARVKLLPPQQLLLRLERCLPLLTGGAQDLLERQQTMRATLAWSEDLLTPRERILFRRVSVFVGGCTLEAAEAVCAIPEGAEPLEVEVLDGLGRLVNQSLVQQREEGGEARFGLLQVVREYALERLEVHGEGDVLRRAHFAYYLALAEESEFELFRAEQRAWRARLDSELDNLRAALGWARDHGEAELGLRLASALVWYWDNAGLFTEARGWYERLFALEAGSGGGGEEISPETWAKALFGAGQAAVLQGDAARGVPLLEQSLALVRGLPGPLAGLALTVLAFAMQYLDDLERAQAYHEDSLAELRLDGEPGLIAMTLLNLGATAQGRNDLESAAAYLAEALTMARRAGDQRVAAMSLLNLVGVALRQGHLEQAAAMEREALTLMRDIGGPYYLACCLRNTAWVAVAAGELDQAARLLGTATRLFETIGRSESLPELAEIEEWWAPPGVVLGEAAWADAFNAGRALSLEEAVDEALETTQQIHTTRASTAMERVEHHGED